MITINLGTIEKFNGEEFEYEEGGVVRFEYTLKVLYDWEGKWKKPFLKSDSNLTEEELKDFFARMALDPIDKRFITEDVMKILLSYLNDGQTATTFRTFQDGQNGNKSRVKSKTYTAEEIYALMFEAGVDLEFENRNLNRLMTILKIVGNHNNPPKKMSKSDIVKENRSLNQQRKAALKSKG